MKNIPLLIGTILGTLAVVVGIAVLFSGSGQPGPQDVVDTQLLRDGARHVRGASDEQALVQVVEFSDFQCPACRAAQPLVSGILEQYGDQVQLIYRHFPLDGSFVNGRIAAQAVETAAQQDKFWQMKAALFDNQQEWSAITNRDELLSAFVRYAETAGLDAQAFEEQLQDTSQVAVLVQEDARLGSSLGVSSTPTFFVNGRMTTAPQLATVVAQELELAANAQLAPEMVPADQQPAQELELGLESEQSSESAAPAGPVDTQE